MQILRPLGVVGVPGSGVDAMQCLLNRDMEAREVFLASGCLPQLVAMFKGNLLALFMGQLFVKFANQ